MINLAEKQRHIINLNNRLREGLMSELDDIIVNGTIDMGVDVSDYGKRFRRFLIFHF